MTEESISARLSRPFDVGELKFFPVAMSKDKTQARVGSYIDARAVMDRLDEVVGVGFWQTKYMVRNENDKAVECTLSLLIDGIWVEKADVGYPNEARDAGNAEKEPFKAAYSDALKRAAVQFGIGRYIYSLELERDWLPVDQYGKFTQQPRIRGASSPATRPQQSAQPAPQEARQPSQPMAPAVTTSPPASVGKHEDDPISASQLAEIKTAGWKFRKLPAQRLDAVVFEKYGNHLHELSVKGAAMVLAWLAESEPVAV